MQPAAVVFIIVILYILGGCVEKSIKSLVYIWEFVVAEDLNILLFFSVILQLWQKSKTLEKS